MVLVRYMLVWWKLYYVRAILPAKEKLSATKQNRRNIFQCSLQIMVALRGRPRYVIAVVTLTRHHYNVLRCRLSVAYYIKSVPSGPLYQSWCDYVFWQLATAPNHQVSKSQWNSDGSLQNITVFFSPTYDGNINRVGLKPLDWKIRLVVSKCYRVFSRCMMG